MAASDENTKAPVILFLSGHHQGLYFFCIGKYDFFAGKFQETFLFQFVDKCCHRLPCTANQLGNIFVGKEIIHRM